MLGAVKEEPAYRKIIQALSDAWCYEPEVWKYALKYEDWPRVREWLQSDYIDNIIEAGRLDQLSWIDTHPVSYDWYEHLEFDPLVSERAHQFGRERTIKNDELHKQYHHLLNQMAQVAQPREEDRLALVAYLIMQDRLGDAFEQFNLLEQRSDTNKQHTRKGSARIGT